MHAVSVRYAINRELNGHHEKISNAGLKLSLMLFNNLWIMI
ncbi:MAG: hypothetical protein ACYCSW_01895 [bacterium]|jgi:hypothetical protein